MSNNIKDWYWYRLRAYFRYSYLNDRLIINDHGDLTVVKLEPEKGTEEFKIEIVAKRSRSDSKIEDDLPYIADFRLFGKQEDRVISITSKGHLILSKLDYETKEGSVLSEFGIELIKERTKRSLLLAVSDRNKYVLVGMEEFRRLGGYSRMLIFKVIEDTLVKMNEIDEYEQDILPKIALECYGCTAHHTLWVGLTTGKDGIVQLYDYNSFTGEFRELKDKRIPHQEFRPMRLHRLDGKFYYTGRRGRYMRLK